MSTVQSIVSMEALPWDWMSRHQNVFHTRPYVESWLQYLGDGDLNVMTIGNGGTEIEAVFPLVRARETILGRPLRIWKCIGWNQAWYPWSFVPCDPEHARSFVALMESRRSEWDGVVVCFAEPLRGEIEAEASKLGLSLIGDQRQVLPFVPVAGSWEEYWARRPKSLRKDVKRLLARAEKRGVRYHRIERAEECREIVDRFFELHAERWASKGQRSRYSQDHRQRFLRSLASGWCASGELLCGTLTLDGQPIAIAVCAVHARKLHYIWPTFDVGFSELSPGKLLLHHLIRDAFALGLCEVDLGPGDDEYKSWWAEGRRLRTHAMLSRGNSRIWARYHLLPRIKKALKPVVQRWRDWSSCSHV